MLLLTYVLTYKHNSVVSIQLITVTCYTYPEKFIRDNVIAPFYKFPLPYLRLTITPNACW